MNKDKEPNCKSSPDGEHAGYWINKGVNFRCYHCGFQFRIDEMKNPPPRHRIEVWRGK